jgi:hypothetical protein
VETLIPYLVEWFERKEQYLRIFSDSDSRLEGWFKGELLVLFTELVRRGIIESFTREANENSLIDHARKQVDFKIVIHGENHLCELKTPCISQSAGTPRNLHFYFSDNDLGLYKDFKKLDQISSNNKWVLAFIYPRPNAVEWENTISSLPSSLQHWSPVTRPVDFQDYLFVSLWKGLFLSKYTS